MLGFVEAGIFCLHFEKYHENPPKSENTGQSEATNNTVHRSFVFSDLKHCLCVDERSKDTSHGKRIYPCVLGNSP